jgi:hypothetical protein
VRKTGTREKGTETWDLRIKRLVSGHEFTRADKATKMTSGFSPWGKFHALGMEYLQAMSIHPEELPLYLKGIETSRGGWLIVVSSAADDTFLLKLILEQTVDEEQFQTRELGMTVLARKLYDPNSFADVIGQIRRWIETTEGDGFLNLSQH